MTRRILLLLLFPALLSVTAPGQPPASPGANPARGHLSERQARRIAILVARHENIDLSDSHIEVNSMDMGADFVPGFSSFIVIRESMTPGPDETLRRYAVSRRTGDVWEMNLCTHYDFPELTRLQRALLGHTGSAAAEIAAQGRELGCASDKMAPTT